MIFIPKINTRIHVWAIKMLRNAMGGGVCERIRITKVYGPTLLVLQASVACQISRKVLRNT